MAAEDAVDVLVRGVVAKWSASGTLNGISLHRQERRTGAQSNPAVGTNFPYCIIFDGSANRTQRSANSEYWQVEFALHVFTATVEGLKAPVDLVRTVFDSDALALTLETGWSLVSREKGRTREVKDDKNVWHSEISYRFLIARSRPA